MIAYANGFTILLALFLLEMGLNTAKVCRPLPMTQWRLIIFAAPAAICAAIPDADIAKAMLAAVGGTFPLNVIIYIPLLARQLATVSVG